MLDVAVLLAGCGLYDGSEPQESVLLLLALAQQGARTICVAPDAPQLHVVNHLDGNEAVGERRLLEEAARLSRGRIVSLQEFEPEAADAVAIPGGYGVGKNLMTGFAVPGTVPEVRPDVARLLGHCLERRKPIGAISLAKLLLEAVAVDSFTERLRSERADEAYHDDERRLVYTPGFLVGDRLDQIAPGIDRLVERLLAWGAQVA
jgi:enhancing lycopene biosynthesis protein 2